MHVNIQTEKPLQSFLLKRKFSSELPLNHTKSRKLESITVIAVSNNDGYSLNVCYTRGSVLSFARILIHLTLNNLLHKEDTVGDALVQMRKLRQSEVGACSRTHSK